MRRERRRSGKTSRPAVAARRRRYSMRTRLVIWPLLSQKVVLAATNGSSGVGWSSPFTSVAREVTAYSPGAGVPQSKVQKVQANPASAPSVSVAGCHASSLICTSTLEIGAPQAAPKML